MKKILSVFLLLALLLTAFAGCKAGETPETTAPSPLADPTEPGEQVFTKNGLKIQLPDFFTDYSDLPIGQGYSFLYAGPYNGVEGIEEKKADMPESVTDLASYAAHQQAIYGGELTQKDGIWTLVYQDPTQNETQTYVCAFYETDAGYWSVKAYCPEDVYATYEADLWSYVTAVTFE